MQMRGWDKISLMMLAAFLVAACSDQGDDGCITRYAVEEGYGHTEHLDALPQVAVLAFRHCSDDDAVSCDMEQLRQRCLDDDGTGCEADFITSEAARCLAQEWGFLASGEESAVFLGYHPTRKRIVWVVGTFTPGSTGAPQGSANALLIDAVKGTVYGTQSAVIG